MKPRLSVLLPVRDAGAFLDACLASLARQSLRAFEIVAVENGSRDGSGARLRAWRRREPRLRILNAGPVGLVSALNRGLAACRAPLVARMDADDLARGDRLARQAAAFAADPGLGVLASRAASFPRAVTHPGFRLYLEWSNGLLTHQDILRNRFIESPLVHPTVAYAAEAVRAAGGYRAGPWPEDYDLWLRLAERGIRFAKLTETLLAWRMHAGRLSWQDARYSRDAFLDLKAGALARALPGPEVVFAGAGQYARRLARRLGGLGVRIMAAFDVDARKWSRRLAGAPVLPYAALPDYAGTFLLAAVGARGARAEVRARLASLGRREGEDFLCVA